jgi:hypothetical protein
MIGQILKEPHQGVVVTSGLVDRFESLCILYREVAVQLPAIRCWSCTQIS